MNKMNDVLESAVMFDCVGDSLVGVAHVPTKSIRRVGVVVVVGGPQYRVGSHRQFTLMARALAEAGYAVLRFDYRGMGDSDGAVRAFDHVDDDIAAAIDALMKSAPSVNQVVLWGLCDAASACMIYGARKDSRVSGLILANPWVRTSAGEATAYLKHYYLRRFLQKMFWKKIFTGQFNILGSIRDLYAKVRTVVRSRNAVTSTVQSFVERMYFGLESSPVNALLLLSGRDLTAQEFNDHVSGNPKWRSLIGSEKFERRDLGVIDHTFSNPGSVQVIAELCVRWLGRFSS